MSNTFLRTGYRIATSPFKVASDDDEDSNPIASGPSSLLSMTFPSSQSHNSSASILDWKGNSTFSDTFVLQQAETLGFETTARPKVDIAPAPSSSHTTSLSKRTSMASDLEFEITVKKMTKKKRSSSKQARKRSTSKEERKSNEGRTRGTSKEERRSNEGRKRSTSKEETKRSTSEEVRRRSTSKEERKRSSSKEQRRRKSKSKRRSSDYVKGGDEAVLRRSSRMEREERKSRKSIEDRDVMTEYLLAAQEEAAADAVNVASQCAAVAAEDTNMDATATGEIRTEALECQPLQPRNASRYNMATDGRQKVSNTKKLTDYERLQQMLNNQCELLSTAEDTSVSSPSCDTRDSGRDCSLYLLDSTRRTEAAIQNDNIEFPVSKPCTQAQQYGIGVLAGDIFDNEFDDETFQEAFDDFSKHYLSLSPWTDGDKAEDKAGKKGTCDLDFEPVARSTAMPRLGRPAQPDDLTGMNFSVLKQTEPTIARLPPPGTSDRARMPMTAMSVPNLPSVTDIETGAAADVATQRHQSMPTASSEVWRRVDATPRRPRTRPRAREPGAVAMIGRAFAEHSYVGSDVEDSTEPTTAVDEESIAASAAIILQHNLDTEAVLQATAVTDEVFVAESIEKGKISRKCKAMIFLAVAGVVILIVGLVVALGELGSDENRPTASPTSMPTASLDDLIDALSGVSSFDTLSTVGTPQHSAMFWLANYDQMDLEWRRRLQERQEHEVLVGTRLAPLVQRYALLVLYYATQNMDGWRTVGGWLDPLRHECDWGPSITCDEQRRIVELDLSRNDVYGMIPHEIELLSSLESMQLNDNKLQGPFPSGIAKLVKLEVLGMSRNQFTGTILSEIGKLSLLDSLDLSYNRFNGTVSNGMFELSYLTKLDLSFNGFSGTILENFNTMNLLSFINLRNNKFTGRFPETFSMGDLASIQVDYNHFTGPMPPEYDFMARRETVTVSNNFMTGIIPYEVPLSDIANATENFNNGIFRLEHVSIADNFFSGTVPSLASFLPSLRIVDFSGNLFTGSVYGFEGTHVEHISFAHNHFNSTLPVEFGTQLRHIDFGGNDLRGTITDQLASLTGLEYLDISDNLLVTGTLPERLGQQALMLGYLNFSHCNLSGTLPSSYGYLRHLASLDLSSNALQGSIPSELGGLESARYINLGSNDLTGTIPATLRACTKLTSLILVDNDLSGSLPVQLSSLPLLDHIVLSGNPLMGVPDG